METSETKAGNKGEKRRSPTAAFSSSTESETFETWTLVTPELPTDRGKEAKASEKSCPKSKSSGNQQDQDDRSIDSIKKEEIHTDGEISDGISIISDSESGGRSSPQPAPRRLSPSKRHSPPKSSLVEQMDEDNDSDNTDGMNKSVIRTGYGLMTPPNTPHEIVGSLAPESIVEETMDVNQNYDRHDYADPESDHPHSSQINFTYAFFIAVLVAFLAVFGRMRNSPMIDNNDLSAVYSKLNEILSKTSHIEAIIQDTMNGLDDRSFDQYSSMLMRMKDLNDKFEMNNLAMKDALQRISKFDKYPTLNSKPGKEQRKNDAVPDIHTNTNNPVLEKPPKSNPMPHEKSRAPQDPRPQNENSRRPQEQEQHNKKPRNNQATPKPEGFENIVPKPKNDYKKREAQNYDQHEKDTRKEHFENGKREAPRKVNNQEYDPRRKNGNKEKHSNGHTKENNFKKHSGEQEEDWMERRRMSREDARKVGRGSGDKRLSDDDSNWYLERGNGRQKARRYEKGDARA